MSGILPASSIDRRLLKAKARYATAQELSDAVLGQLSPAQALQRVNELLDEKSIPDEIRERRLLLVQMAEWSDWLREQKDNPKSWAAINRSLALLSNQIERSNINLEDVSTKLSADHARFFMDGFSLGFNKVLDLIKERLSVDIDEAEVIEMLEVGTRASADYLERVTLNAEQDDDA